MLIRLGAVACILRRPMPWILFARRMVKTLGSANGLAALKLFLLIAAVPCRAQADVLVDSCSEVALRNAINSGGTIPFTCNQTILLSAPLIVSKDTTLDATGYRPVLDATNGFRVFLVETNVHFTLVGVTLRHGKADHGGAIYANGGQLEILRCRFESNQASTSVYGAAAGAAIWSSGASLRIADSVFIGNSVTAAESSKASGGAISFSGDTLQIDNSTFLSNSVNSGDGDRGVRANDAEGGAIWTTGSLRAQNCTFTGNATKVAGGRSFYGGTSRGGALYSGTAVVLQDCLFLSNQASAGISCSCGDAGIPVNGDGFGGALFNLGTLQASSCTFASNGVLAPDRTSYFGPHVGKSFGGAIYNAGACWFTNCTWIANFAAAQRILTQSGSGPGYEGPASGSALFQTSGLMVLTYCTVASNAIISTNLNGSALGIGTNGSIRISSSLLSGNSFHNVDPDIIDDGNNLSSDDSGPLFAPTSRMHMDAKVGAFGFHGGATPSLELLPGSPAIDAITNSCSAETDQRGFGRPIGPGCDIGAFEFQPAVRMVRDDQGILEISAQLQPSSAFQVDRSVDLSSWTPLTVASSNASGELLFTDPAKPEEGGQFYRMQPVSGQVSMLPRVRTRGGASGTVSDKEYPIAGHLPQPLRPSRQRTYEADSPSQRAGIALPSNAHRLLRDRVALNGDSRGGPMD